MRRLIVGLAAAPLGLAGQDRGAVRQAYRVAREQLERALTDPRWTAAHEQTRGYSHLPPAAVVDIDPDSQRGVQVLGRSTIWS